MFFPIPLPDDWPANLSRSGMKEGLSQINWIPFNYHIGGGIKADIRSGFRDVFLNVLLTVPIGLGFGFLFRPRWYMAFLVAPLVGLAFEGAQLFFKIVLGVFFHAVDMSDVVTNTAGVAAGAMAFMIARVILKKLTSGHSNR
jgi:glycopeptide antibiotics resistance protein